jgi:hypothetical protein
MKTCLTYISLMVLFSLTACNSPVSNNKNISAGITVTSEPYYVDFNHGDDSHQGTMREPIKTIAELNIRLQKRPASAFFAGGQTFDGTLLLKGIGYSEKNPVTISSWGEGRAVINGGNNEAIKIEDCQNVLIVNLNIRGNGRKVGNVSNGLAMVHTEKSKISQLKTEGFQKSGVYLLDCKQIEVKQVLATENGFCGINVMATGKGLSKNILIGDCSAENNPGDPSNLDNHSGNGILVGVSDSVMVDHCTATNNGWDMPREGNGPVGIWTWESSHVTIQYCISYRNKTSVNAKDGGGFDLDGGVTGSVIQYCLSYENQGAGYGLFQYAGASDWSDNIIRYCVSINDGNTTQGAGSFFIWNGSGDSKQLTDCQIYNNVIYNSSNPVISFESASAHKNFVFCNNIFLGSGQLIIGENRGSSFIGNTWWNAGKGLKFSEFNSLAKWSRATGQEMIDGKQVGIQEDPMLKGPFLTDITDPYQLKALEGYTLKPGSPIRNRGINIKSIFKLQKDITDFFGNPVPLGDGPEPGIGEIR